MGSTTNASGTKTGAATEETAGDEASEDASLHLSAEILKFKIWHPMTSAAAPYVDTIEDNFIWSKVEEMFGVELTFANYLSLLLQISVYGATGWSK